MQNDTLLDILDTLQGISHLLDTMPQRICDELANREELLNQKRKADLQAEMDFLKEHNAEINKFMYGFGAGKYKIEPDDPNDQKTAEQYEAILNHMAGEVCNGNKS